MILNVCICECMVRWWAAETFSGIIKRVCTKRVGCQTDTYTREHTIATVRIDREISEVQPGDGDDDGARFLAIAFRVCA